MKLGKPRRAKTVFELASEGAPMTDDQLAQLSPEQRAYWESLRSGMYA